MKLSKIFFTHGIIDVLAYVFRRDSIEADLEKLNYVQEESSSY